ncbi:hypothetical protein B0O40_1290 [Ruminococcaceae bacterium R-25]|nr:hypothetical protein B0O40_1290 [Ruminococcaceae bacterium R-25]SUQ11899.1 hypothetical protein SAMN06297423_1290 [Oscillospiraceae bacterium]
MLIEILSEDKSGAIVVERLSERITESEGIKAQVNVHPHRGCGSLPKDMTAKPPKFANSLLDLLPSELRAYNKIYAGKDIILIIAMDSDDKDPQALRQEIYSVASKFAPDIRSVVGISTEEIEAWVLGDKSAIIEAYPDTNKDVLDSYVQDSVCGTWEILCRAVSENAEELIDIGYPAIGHYKALWTENISKYMLPQRNVSPSFNTFKMALITALKNPVPIYRRREF